MKKMNLISLIINNEKKKRASRKLKVCDPRFLKKRG
jgi:hypothetical protein